MPSFSIPLTGLESDNTALNTIANNLSNMSTTGFKSQTTDFSALFYQQLGANGAGDPIEVGTGVGVAATKTDFSSGPISSTTTGTDMALNGDGFFVTNGSNGSELTRAGDFSVANNGDLVTSSGAAVMGYPAVSGVVNTNSALVPINLPVGQTQQPLATSSFGLTANLDAGSAIGTVVPATIPIYDSLGVAHTVTVSFTKAANNTWDYAISLPASDTGSASTATNTTGILTFDSNGNLLGTAPTTGVTVTTSVANTSGAAPGTVTTTVPATLSAPGTSTTVTTNASAITTTTTTYTAGAATTPAPSTLGSVMFSGLNDGAAPLNLSLDLTGASGSSLLTQVADTSGVSASSQNGYASGTYDGFTVAGDGTISAKFSNGEITPIGQIAVATVSNEQGLLQVGGNAYATTLSSGAAAYGQAGSGGAGTIEGDALEGSNVDISAEFSNLIVAQRAFEANSKSITTFDTITQETINMIH